MSHKILQLNLGSVDLSQAEEKKIAEQIDKMTTSFTMVKIVLSEKSCHFVNCFEQQYIFPSISYYFRIPKFFDYLDFHCPYWKK